MIYVSNGIKDGLATWIDLRTTDCQNRSCNLNLEKDQVNKTGRPKLRYKEIMKRNLEAMNNHLDKWQYLSKNFLKIEEKYQQDVIIRYDGQLVVVVVVVANLMS